MRRGRGPLAPFLLFLAGSLQDNKRILTAGHEKIIRVFDLERPDAEPLKIEGSTAALRTCLWHTDDPSLIVTAGSDEKAIRVWDVRTLSECQSVECAAPCLSMELSPDGGALTTADGDAVNFYDARALKLQQSVRVPYGVESASMHAPGKRFVAGGQDMWVHVHDLETGEEVESHIEVLSVQAEVEGEQGQDDDFERRHVRYRAARLVAAMSGGAAPPAATRKTGASAPPRSSSAATSSARIVQYWSLISSISSCSPKIL